MNTKSILSLTAIVAAFALLVAPLAASSVEAGSSITQTQKQTQVLKQNSQTIGFANILSGNNLGFNAQALFGGQVAGN